MPRTKVVADTAELALDVAERLVQTGGFNGFSYADVATNLGITKAALHYHYPTKSQLGMALIERYTHRFMTALAAIDAATELCPAKLEAYIDVYRQVLVGHRMCLCGMLAAEQATLPAAMRSAVTAFFDQNETWLAAALDAGRSASMFRFDEAADDAARAFISTLEGGMLLSRLHDDPTIFNATSERLLNGFLEVGPAER